MPSYDPTEPDEAAPAETIDERVERGRQSGSIADGAIVPFSPGLSGDAIFRTLTGRSKADIERRIRGGFKATFYGYRSSKGELLQEVVRWDHPTEQKSILPIRYVGKGPSGLSLSWSKAIEKPWPLYGLDRLTASLDAPVLVTEGEKAADAASKLFPDHVCITWMSGANNVHHAEMLPLRGRHLVLWPDNDPPGRQAMRRFAARALGAGAASVSIVDIPPEFGEKWDLADPLPKEVAELHPLADLIQNARPLLPADVAGFADDRRAGAENRRLLGHPVGYTKVTLKDAYTALSVLDPDMYGNEWRKVGRCFFHAYGAAGLGLFDEWSKGSKENKYREGEPAKMWEAFGAEKKFSGPALAWLFRRARDVLADRMKQDEGRKPNFELNAEAFYLAAIEELSEDHAVVVRGGKTAVLRERYDPRWGRYSLSYLGKRDFEQLHVRRVPLPADHDDQHRKKVKTLGQGALWFGSARRREYEAVLFAPGEPLSPSFLNTWQGFAVEPTDHPEGWSKLKEHIWLHVARQDQASYDYLLNWLAFAVQRLGYPIGVALILIGAKGAGKSIITQILAHLFGQHAFITSRMDDVVGRFNERLETTLLLGLEEAIAPQDRAADGILKDILTRPTLRLEGKFFGLWEGRNHLRVIVTSNNELVVRADASERRYAVFEVQNPHQPDPHARRRYFGLMMDQMEMGGYSAMLGELLKRDIADWNPEAIPETEALRHQKMWNLTNDPVRLYLYERLNDGTYITARSSQDATPTYLWSASETVWVPARYLNEDFREFTQAHGLRFSERMLAIQLPRYMPEGFRSTPRRPASGDSITGQFKAYPFPPLDEARRRFEEVTGLKIDREPEFEAEA